MNSLIRLFQITREKRGLLLEAAFYLTLAHAAIAFLPFKWISHFLGEHMSESPETMKMYQRGIVEKISWAVHAAGRHLPWNPRCLTRAVAAKGMLKRRKVPSTLYLGVAKDGQTGIKAHAWLRSGEIFVCGHEERAGYTVVSTFGEGQP